MKEKMMKMFGSMSATELKRLVEDLEKGQDKSVQVAIPAGTLIELFNAHQNAVRGRFFYDLGKELVLEESREAFLARIPEVFHQEFFRGVKEREILEAAVAKCETCECTVPKRGKLLKRIDHGKNTERMPSSKV